MPFIDMEEGGVLHEIEDDVKIFQDRIGAVVRNTKQMRLMIDRHEQAGRAAQGMLKDAETLFHEYQTQATAVISELQLKLKHSLAKQSALETENLALKHSLKKKRCLDEDEGLMHQDDDFMQLRIPQENINSNMNRINGEDVFKDAEKAMNDATTNLPDVNGAATNLADMDSLDVDSIFAAFS
tara:strand:+ start:5149 stop:5697 length:549 start_codon:yes stop_codon:yes gene_type:complete